MTKLINVIKKQSVLYSMILSLYLIIWFLILASNVSIIEAVIAFLFVWGYFGNLTIMEMQKQDPEKDIDIFILVIMSAISYFTLSVLFGYGIITEIQYIMFSILAELYSLGLIKVNNMLK